MLKVIKDLWESHRSWVYTALGAALFLVAGTGVTLFTQGTVTQSREPQVPSGIVASATQNNNLTIEPEMAATPVPEQKQEQEPEPAQWCLYITGAVRKPDVYYIPKGSRLHHLVEAAGGFNNFADREAVNLAEPLEDGWHVHIPRKGENQNTNVNMNNNMYIVTETPMYAPGMPDPVQTQPTVPVAQNSTNLTTANFTPAQTRVQSSRTSSGVTVQRTASSVSSASGISGPVNINRATQQELQTIKGIGPVFAARIIEYRQKYGGFARIEDIMKVKGIGQKTFEKMREQITVR